MSVGSHSEKTGLDILKEFLVKQGLVPKKIREEVHRRGKTFTRERTVMVRPEEMTTESKNVQYRGSSPEKAKRLNTEVSNIEQRLRPELHTEVTGIDSRLTEQPEFGRLKGVIPRGWGGSGLTWDDTPGIYSRRENKVFISFDPTIQKHVGCSNLLCHEYGHGVYDRLSTVERVKFLGIWDKVRFDVCPYEGNNVDEYFAETFARWITKDVGNLAVHYNDHDMELLLPDEAVEFFEGLNK